MHSHKDTLSYMRARWWFWLTFEFLKKSNAIVIRFVITKNKYVLELIFKNLVILIIDESGIAVMITNPFSFSKRYLLFYRTLF